MAPTTKGMRQPKSRNCCSVSSASSTTISSTASSCPPISVTYWNDEKKPRWPFSATSLMYVAVVPYSPPTDKPWNKRHTSSRKGAQAPICA